MRGEALCGSAPLRAKMKFIPLASLAPWRDANTSLLATQVPLRARDELRKDQPLLRSHCTTRAAAFYFFFCYFFAGLAPLRDASLLPHEE